VLVGAGDIAVCDSGADEATARLLDDIAGTVFTAGDNAYPDGAIDDYRRCYGPSWGRHRDRTIPATGNHDHVTRSAAGYRSYFDNPTGAAGRLWYSTDRGAWHIIVLDSECWVVRGCAPQARQGRWLAADLAANGSLCTLAIWHRPRFSSGQHGNDPSVDPLWRAVAEGGVDLVINGHDHDYERFAPQSASGEADPRGTREIVVGTGGGDLRPFEDIVANSEVRDHESHGVLKLTLRDGGYDWEFIPVRGDTFRDAGSGSCH
jgi:hypothetical protein